VREAEVPPFRVFVVKVIVDGEGLVHQHAAGFQRVQQVWNERAIEVKKDHDDVIRFLAEIRLVGSRLFQIDGSRDDHELTRTRGGCELGQFLLVAVDGVDLIAVRGKEERMAPGSCRYVQGLALGEPRQLLNQKRRGRRIDLEHLLVQSGPLDGDPD